MTGPQGELGARGSPGKPGLMGFQGEQGLPGIAGKPGVPVCQTNKNFIASHQQHFEYHVNSFVHVVFRVNWQVSSTSESCVDL